MSGEVNKINVSKGMIEYLRLHFISKRKDNLVNADIDPGTTETYDLGDASHKWNNIHVKTLVADNITGGGSVNAFTDLSDVPGTYSGDGLDLVRVKNTEDGLEFAALVAGDGLFLSTGAGVHTLDAQPGTLISVDATSINLADGSAQYQVPVTGGAPFSPVYTALSAFAGNGIAWGGSDYTIDLDTDPGLQVGAGGLSILLDTDPGLQLGAGGLSFFPTTNAALVSGPSGVYLNLAGVPGLQILSNELSVKLDVSSGLQIVAGGLEMGSPSTVHQASSNTVSGATHNHAVTASSNPGASSVLLKSDTSGNLQLEHIGIGTSPTSALLTMRSTVEPQLRVEYDASNFMTLYVTDVGQAIFDGNNDIFLRPGDDLFLDPDAAIIVQPGENPITPIPNYFVDLGTTVQQFRSIYAAELVVQTLVAQDVIATIGGEILVGPTTILEQNLIGTDKKTIVFSGAENGSSESSSDVIVNVPAGTVDGDAMIAVVSMRHSTAIGLVTPTGWQQLRLDTYASNLGRTGIYFRRASSEPASYTFSCASSVDRMVASILVYENVNSVLPRDVALGQSNASSTSVTAPSVTTNHEGVMLLYVGTTNFGTTFTEPSGMTERSDKNTGTLDATGLTHEIAEELLTSPGATGTNVGTAVDAAENLGQHLGLEPQYDIVTRHNNLFTGNVIVLKDRGVIEFAYVEGSPSGAGPYTYPVGRDIDATGFNTWYAGDSVFNTGGVGDGFIDLYSQNNLIGDNSGPTITGYVRNSQTYNDYGEHWAIGNLKNIYGTGAVDKWGVALGPYQAGKTWISLDATDGLKINNGITPTVYGQWKTDGSLVIGEVAASKNNISIDSTNGILIRDNVTTRLQITPGGTLHVGRIANNLSRISIDGGNGVRVIHRDGSSVDHVLGQWAINGDLTIGEVATNSANIFWDQSAGQLNFRGGTSGTVIGSYIDTDGSLIFPLGGTISNDIFWKFGSQDIFTVGGFWNDASDIAWGTLAVDTGATFTYSELVLAATTNAINLNRIVIRSAASDAGYIALESFARVSRGLYVGSAVTQPNDNDIHYQGSLNSVKGGTDYLVYGIRPLTTALKDTSGTPKFEGQAHSTTSKTLVGMNSRYGTPTTAKGFLVFVQIRDSGSANNDAWLILSPNATNNEGINTRIGRKGNDVWKSSSFIVPATGSGDLYYQILASGTNTLDAYIHVWGYLI